MTALRYARQAALPEVGAAGQARLARARVLLVGLGGLGCPAAEYLSASGVGTLVLNDFDEVDETNLARQILYTPADVGRRKVEAAAERLRQANPGVAVQAVAERLTSEALAAAVAGVEVVLDGTDNFATRLAVNEACVAAAVPLVSGAVVRLEGQLAVFPNRRGEPCYRCLYDEEDEWLGDCQGQGVLSPVPGVIGTMMAVETLKLLLGLSSRVHNRLLLWDAASGDWQSLAVKARSGCPACGGGASA